MDFALTEEQELLRHSVQRLFADHYAFDARKRYAQEPGGYSRAMWARYAELGLLGLPFAEEHGGSAGGPVETMIVMEEVGRALALEPYFSTVVLDGGLPAWQRAVSAGAEVIYPLEDQFYGERGGRLRDPFGQQWMMSQHIEDVSAEEMARRAATFFGQ